MKQIARLMFIAVFFATLSLPALAAERGDEAPKFYVSYNIGECKAIASGIGTVTAIYLYLDIAGLDSLVADIIHVSYDLPPGYFGSASETRESVTVKIIGSPGLLYGSNHCKV